VSGTIRRRLHAGLIALGLGWLALAIGLLADAARPGPEPMLRGYLADLEAQRLPAALEALAPERRESWRPFVEFQQYNRYRVQSIAVRSPSLLEALSSGELWLADQATLVVDVTEPSGLTWRGSTVVPLVYREGRFVMVRPPFAAE
jgi:hypothetical protein